VITRFAPAPTGYLHLGHVVNALYVWGLAGSRGGDVRLRIEDHDRQRSRREYEAAILEDLAWLGFVSDGPVVRQSGRDAIYRAAVARLEASGLVYGCACTRAEILEATRARRAPSSGGSGDAGDQQELWYPNTCRNRHVPPGEGLGWRVRMDPGVESFDDVFLGRQQQDPAAQCGDLLIRDRLGNWTYQFAVVADDLEQGITDVIRGVDLLASTGRQIRLARLLGRVVPPRFAHHPLVMKSPTEKLSKSDRDTGVRDLRAAGWTAAGVLAHARTMAPLDEDLARPGTG
jgi:glutamyl-tRNA synthetase/glutamyl-Q tRNA(Asp) synthetase